MSPDDAPDMSIDLFPLVQAYSGGQGRRRSVDLRFFRPALYRLSYLTSQTGSLRSRLGGHDGI